MGTIEKAPGFSGIVQHLFIKPRHGAPMRPVQRATAITSTGLQEDVNCGKRKRQLLLIEAETLRDFGLDPGDVRENIVISGLPLAGTKPGTRLHAGPVELEVTNDCAPCEYMNSLRPGLQRDIEGRRGTLCRVVNGGFINVGDTVGFMNHPID